MSKTCNMGWSQVHVKAKPTSQQLHSKADMLKTVLILHISNEQFYII